MKQPDFQNDFPHVVRLYHQRECSPEHFAGSGIILGPQHVLTCAHVAEILATKSLDNHWFAMEADGKIAKVIQGPFSSEADRQRDPTLLDLAVFELVDKDIEDQPRTPRNKPVTVLTGVTFGFLMQTFNVSRILAAGGVGLGTDPYGMPMKHPGLAPDGTPGDFQFHGGIKEGFSGGPVVICHEDEWVCVGINWLGRKESGNSRFLSGDSLHSYLKSYCAKLINEQYVRFVDIEAATILLRQSVDPTEVKRRHREAKNAILDYAKNVIQSDRIALNALADFLGTAQNASIVVASLFWDGESDQIENSTSNRNQPEIPKPIERLLDFARKRSSDLQQMDPATILAIRNVAICFSFPNEMQQKALEQCIANNPIPAPDHDTKWSMIFICSVLGTIDRMSHKTNDNNGRIRHRLLNGGESMIDIHVNQLFPATRLPVSPPRESGADSVRFLTDICLGLARELDLNSDESEILNFFQQWTGGTFPTTCDSIERLKAEFLVWKTWHAELLLLIPEHRTHSELRKIRTLFPEVQLVSVPSKEASEIGTLKIYIRSFDDMANPKDLNSK